MAKYLIQDDGSTIVAAATHPAAPDSGDPVRFGTLTGVAITDEGDGGNASTDTTIDVGLRVWDLVVDDNETGGIAAGAASIAKILFFVFIVLFLLSLIAGVVRGRKPAV